MVSLNRLFFYKNSVREVRLPILKSVLAGAPAPREPKRGVYAGGGEGF